ncbi:hypothetical protein [Actinoplanes sp. GCM10030250]|uniref:hypothetical protein n=1 Tax=Actinoplanes sp. GCM10030250 TaxID=3273376 RepID=UPI003616B986
MNLRRIAASLLSGAALATILAVGTGSAAQAAGPQCDNGDRSSARFWSDTGDYYTPVRRTWTNGTSYNKVELRFNEDSQCAWGVYSGGRRANLYLEYREDGYRYQVDRRSSSRYAYTGVWSDQEPREMRACAADAGRVYCTGWY